MMIRRGGYSGAGMGAVENSFWPTTGDVDSETNSLEQSVAQLGRDVFTAFGASDTLSGDNPDFLAFSSAWNAFYEDFEAWRTAGWFWNPTRRDQLLEYRTRYNALLLEAKRLGVGTLAAPLADHGEDPVSKLLGTFGTVAIVLGVGIAGYFGVKVWNEYQSVKS
jgi:hypothetical protein